MQHGSCRLQHMRFSYHSLQMGCRSQPATWHSPLPGTKLTTENAVFLHKIILVFYIYIHKWNIYIHLVLFPSLFSNKRLCSPIPHHRFIVLGVSETANFSQAWKEMQKQTNSSILAKTWIGKSLLAMESSTSKVNMVVEKWELHSPRQKTSNNVDTGKSDMQSQQDHIGSWYFVFPLQFPSLWSNFLWRTCPKSCNDNVFPSL